MMSFPRPARTTRLASVVRWGALLLAACAPALAAASATTPDAAEREWNFRVLLDSREVGWHRYVVRGGGEATEVESRAEFDVRLLFLNAYRYRHQASERWRGACLDALASRTETNGDVDVVAANARGGSLVVAGPAGDSRHAGCVMSFAYWDPRILEATRLLNPQTGELLPVRVANRGVETVDVAGRSVAATRHQLSGPGLQIDLWYSDGRWIALEAPTPGGRVLRYELK
jgi:Family of unknown function (DUF6134)